MRSKFLQTETTPGWLGKGNFPHSRSVSLLILTGALAGCDIPGRVSRNLGSGEILAVYGLEGRWAGPVTPAGSRMRAADDRLDVDRLQEHSRLIRSKARQ